MPSKSTVQDLVDLVLSGKILESFDKYYADNVSMQENHNPPTVGKAANRTREEKFIGSIKEFHGASTPEIVVDGDNSVIHWIMDYTNTDGVKVHFDQLAHQKWEGDKVVFEKFYYDTGAGAH